MTNNAVGGKCNHRIAKGKYITAMLQKVPMLLTAKGIIEQTPMRIAEQYL